MSGLGALIDGAFKGYTYGEGVKDMKRRLPETNTVCARRQIRPPSQV